MNNPSFTRLIPPAGPVSAHELVAHLRECPVPADRPYTVANFVMSVSGQATLDGRSAPLSDPGDRALFHALRSGVDGVLAGTGTLRYERYGRPIPNAETRAARVARGLREEPLAVVLSRSGHVPFDIPLFSCPEVEAVVFTRRLEPSEPPAATVHHEPDPDPAAAMAVLRHRYGVRLLLCEGGPALFAGLASAGLVDELFLTLGPLLTPADAPAIVAGETLDRARRLTLRSAAVRNDTLFLAYRVGAPEE